jgi:hypothetical protein
MQHDHEGGAAAIRHANARVAELREKVAREVVSINQRVGLAAEGDGLDLPCVLYGIK